MRNLKKVLSLALAMVMLLGMMVVGASAADATEYPDYGEVSANKQEAVQVITALSVMDGTEKGMEPQSNLNRAMAATIVARALLGRTVADALASSTCVFTDVPDWAKGAVQYCADRGIVFGIGNNLFGSNNPVKGTEFATMLLRAVDPEGDYSGSGWENKAIVAANKFGLSDKVAVTSTALTREGAAQMAFNTITSYSPSGATAWGVDGKTFDSFIEAYLYADKLDKVDEIEKTPANDTLAATVFGLTEAGDVDKFGTPVKNWKYEDEVIATVSQNTAVKTYTEEKTDLSKDLDGYSFSLNASSAVNAEKWVDGTKTTFSAGNVADTIEALTGNGVRVDIYASNKVISKVVVIHELLGTVSRVNEASGDTKRSVTLSGMKFETEAFEKGDKVIYTVAGNAIQSMQLAEVVESTSVSSARDDRVNTGAGTFYFHKGHSVAANDWNFDGTYNLFLDSYGYIIGQELVEGEAAAPQYALVTRLDKSGFDKIAMLVLPDGSTVRATLSSDSKWGLGATTIEASGDPVLVSFTEDNGEYKLDDAVTSLVNVDKNKTIVETGNAKVSNITGVETANSSTLFFVKTGTNKFTVYQGIRNVPTLKTTDGGSGTKASALHGEKSTVALAVYVDASSTTNVSNSGSSTSASIFVLGNDSGVIRDSAKGNHYTYIALVDGEIVEEFDVKTDSRVETPTLYNTVSYDKNDVATLSGVVDSVTGTVEPTGEVVVLGGLGGTGYTYDDETLVFYIENDDLTPSSVSAIESDSNDTVWVAANNNGKANTIIIKDVADSAPAEGDPNKTIVSGSTEVAAPESGKTVTVTGTPSNPTEAKVNGDVKGAVEAGANTTVEIKGGVTASANVTAETGSTVTITGDVAATSSTGGTVSVTGGNVTIKGNISANAVEVKAGTLTVTEVPAAGAIKVASVSGNVTINVNAPAANKDVVLAGINVSSAAAAADKTVTIKINGNVVQELTQTRAVVTPYTIPEFVRVEVSGDIKAGAAINVTGALTVKGNLAAGSKVTVMKGATLTVEGGWNEAVTLGGTNAWTLSDLANMPMGTYVLGNNDGFTGFTSPATTVGVTWTNNSGAQIKGWKSVITTNGETAKVVIPAVIDDDGIAWQTFAAGDTISGGLDMNPVEFVAGKTVNVKIYLPQTWNDEDPNQSTFKTDVFVEANFTVPGVAE